MDQINLHCAKTAQFPVDDLGFYIYSVYREIKLPATVSLY